MPQSFISFNEQITPKTVQVLISATFDQMNRGATEIVYLFSTPGGSVSDGITAYNIIKGLPIPTTMINVGSVDSIGVCIFLAGKKRIACPNSTFMLHGVTQGAGNAQLELKDLKERIASIEADHRKVGGIISSETALIQPEIDGLFIDAQTINPETARSKGIIHEIAPVAIPAGVQPIQLIFFGQSIF